MIDPDKEKLKETSSSYMSRAKARTDEFVRETRYKSLLRGGLRPEQAASMLGVKFRSGDKFKASDILRAIIKGRKTPEEGQP
jgi:hypothetical protein